MARLIPFWMLPAFWGLTGTDRELEYIKYNYDGMDQETRLNQAMNKNDNFEFTKMNLDIKLKYNVITNYDYDLDMNELLFRYKKKTKQQFNIDKLTILFENENIDQEEYDYSILDEKYKTKKENAEYQKSKLDLDKLYGKITEKEYEYKSNDLSHAPSSIEWQKNKIELDLKYGDINQQQYDKSLYTINGEPYFEVINGKFDTPDEVTTGTGGFSFEFDYNEIFVERLKEEGWTGHTDQQIVDEYFKEICKQAAYEEEIFTQENVTFGPTIESVNNGDITRFS